MDELEKLWPKAYCGCGHHFNDHDTVFSGNTPELFCKKCACVDYDGPTLDEE